MPIPASSILPLLDDVKVELNITSSTHDSEVQDKLDAAVRHVERRIGPLDARAVTETHYSVRPGLPLLLRHYPALSVDSVVDADGATIDSDSYTVDLTTGRVWLSRWSGGLHGWDFWGAHLTDVTVTYSAGRASLDADVRELVLEVAARLWQSQRGNAPSALPVDDGSFVDPGGLPLLSPKAAALMRDLEQSRGQV